MEYRTIQQLMTAHPKLFKGACPRVPSVNPRGWGVIVHELCTKIEVTLNERDLQNFEIAQIKEKFGALRFYYEGLPDDDLLLKQIRALVAEAEKKSRETCMACGQPAQLSTEEATYSTYCPACLAKPMAQRYSPEDLA
ncbi:MAG: hypothetical protein ACXWJZ_04890 [Burkholderiaceae bacterium]